MGFGYIENASKQITKLRDRVALLNHLEWIFANYRAGRRRRTAGTLGPRWPLLSHPFVFYIGKTWPSHGPNMAPFKSDVISVKNFKKIKNKFRVKFGARVKTKLQIVFTTINLIYPENLCLSVWLFAYFHSPFIQTTFYQSFVQIGACFNCSTPSKIKLSCLGEHYYHKILLLLLSTYTEVSHLLQGQQKKINYSAPIRDIELKFRR